MKRRSKIVCTLGPAVDSRDKVQALVEAGMNVARLNCSHGDWETRRRWIGWLRELSDSVAPIGILADLQGPKFRIGEIEGGTVDFETGQTVLVGPEPGAGIPIFEPPILAALDDGVRVLLGDGVVELKLASRVGGNFEARVVSGGPVKSRQGITVVDKVFDTPALTEKDIADVREACLAGVDFIALSYVKSAADIRELRREVDKYDPSIRLCAKVETRDALNEIEEIAKVSDVVMVARGDLGLQMDLEQVPLAQKTIIHTCNRLGCPVITATQMLESMIGSPRPTRAEAADVANAILDGTDAVMLSGETATGRYPVESVRTMARIAVEAEHALNENNWTAPLTARNPGVLSATDAVASAVAQLARHIKPKAILTTTTSGQTARLVSKYRPEVPILCATWERRTQAFMSVVWGVEAIYTELAGNSDETTSNAINAFLRCKRLHVGDGVLITAGVPAGIPGHTNLIHHLTVK